MASESEISKLQAVKELIFGQEIKDYDAEFKQIHGDLQELGKQLRSDDTNLRKMIENLEKTLTSRIDRVEADLQKKFSQLDHKKTDRAKLGKMLIQIGEKLQNQ